MAENIRTLSGEERTAACAKFCDISEVPPTEAVQEAFSAPMNREAAILPDQIGAIFRSDAPASGYCLIPCEGAKDGGYAAFTTFFPKATVEMLQWWYPWRGLRSVHYTASNSAHNHSVGMSAGHKRKICSSAVPLEAKSRGIVQALVKDTGACGLEDFVVHLARPEEMGIDAGVTGDAAALIGGWWMREDRKSNEPYRKAIDMFAHVCIQEADGVAVRTFLWCGYRGLKGKNLRMDTYGPVIDESYVRQIGLAAAQELAQLAAILPDLYACEHGAFTLE